MRYHELIKESLHFVRPGELRGSYTDKDMIAMGFRKAQNGSWYIDQLKWQALIQSGKLREAVNPKVFLPAFNDAETTIQDKKGKSYHIIAKPGPRELGQKFRDPSRLFTIEVYPIIKGVKGRNRIAWVNFTNEGDHIEAEDVYVDAKYRNKGLATAMYKFAQNLGNDILPSSKQTRMGKQYSPAMRSLTEASIQDQLKQTVKKLGGNLDDYFVRFTNVDKLGFSDQQVFKRSLDVDDPEFEVDQIGPLKGRRALWFYPLKYYLKSGYDAYATEHPYVWLVKLKPDAWLQPVGRGDDKVKPAPAGKQRVGILRMGLTPAAIFFTHGYDVVDRFYDYAKQHKRHGQIKGAPKPTLMQRLKKLMTNEGLSNKKIKDFPTSNSKKIQNAAIDFYMHEIPKIPSEPVEDYIDKAKDLLRETPPNLRERVLNVLQQGKKNPYIQGGVITAVGAVLAGAALTSAQRMGLTPTQTNMLLQAILNTVIPTMVSRVNGRNWRDTIKYTLASMGVGTGIAAITEREVKENFADKKVKGKSRPGRVKRAGASCAGSVTDLRKRAKKYGGERGRMYHWCANMKSGQAKKK